MFCPKCGTENLDGASFCRACGSNISLVPQALTGTLRDQSVVDEGRLGRRERRELERERRREFQRRVKKPSVEHAVVPFFGGVGFVCVALSVMLFRHDGMRWGFWMFIPAFFMIGSGVSEYLRWKQSQSAQPQIPAYTPPPALRGAQAPSPELRAPRPTSEINAPGSVTEGTTKLLERDQ